MTPQLALNTSPQVRAVTAQATLVIPVGSTEQHGPHLPVITDSLVAEQVARQAARLCERSGTSIFVAPALCYGSSHHHLPRSGTLSLRSVTLRAVLEDLLESAITGGFRSLVLLNGHGGNQDIVHQAARDVALRRDVRVAATSYWTLAWECLIEEARHHGIGPVPGHAGSFETSLVMHLMPETVDATAIPDTPVIDYWDSRHPLSLPLVEQHGWVHKIGGYTDRATLATPAIGQALFEHIVAGFATFLSDFCVEIAGEADATKHTEPECNG